MIQKTVRELYELGLDNIPMELKSAENLIYSSPATLSYNSPGAQGFGVKRAGLVIPESIMLVVSPACCGRNTTVLADEGGYSDRIFFLQMDETDLVTGRHLTEIPEAINQIIDICEPRPKVVVICITCVDALLGTDLERVCRKAEKECGVKVVPSYMYALTREGKNPPMVAIREAIYSLIERNKVRPEMVNLIGNFTHLEDDCELYEFLKSIGLTDIREVGRIQDYDEYVEMGEANFNLILNPEARKAAFAMEKKLGIPYAELTRLYQLDRIRRQYMLFGAALGVKFDDEKYYQAALEATDKLREAAGNLRFSIGQVVNGNPLEMALAMAKLGLTVDNIFTSVTKEDEHFIRELYELLPDMKIYQPLAPGMISFEGDDDVDIAIGLDTEYYYPDAIHVKWNDEIQPFGYTGLIHFAERIIAAVEEAPAKNTISFSAPLSDEREFGGDFGVDSIVESLLAEGDGVITDSILSEEEISSADSVLREEAASRADSEMEATFRLKAPAEDENRIKLRGLRKYLSPFTPDQSGAVSVLYNYGGMLIILDAGGCVGNICGYDEPRWETHKSAIYSAGLRDLDAILGRDELLIRKTGDALDAYRANFVGLIGTPVPAVIATDYRALKRLMENKYEVPVIPVETDGMELYDRGQEKAYLHLFKTYLGSDIPNPAGDIDTPMLTSKHLRIGVIGATPLDTTAVDAESDMREALFLAEGDELICYGISDTLYDVSIADSVDMNIVVSPSGLKAARWLEDKKGIPYRVNYPMSMTSTEKLSSKILSHKPEKVLILHQQIFANEIRDILRNMDRDIEAIDVATWFMLKENYAEPGDKKLIEETELMELVRERGYDMVIGDPLLKRALPEFEGIYLSLPHYTVSGSLYSSETTEEYFDKAGEVVW